MDNKNNAGKPEGVEINVDELYEVEYWKKTLGLSEEELKKAVAAVGTSPSAIRRYLVEHPKTN